ncbi:MAG: hypothetical protein HQK50_06195 [Oligoflexia bacterium]|nr:hypothetical protein [Oligoflexia bacterium]MBF0365142.1 hypothetical protein [Oligoflexia bacterium]
MMLTQEDACKILRVSAGEAHDKIESAYLKMMKRYPPEFFPEKSLAIRQAYNFLVGDDEFWKHFIQDDSLDLHFLLPHLLPASSLDHSSVGVDAIDLAQKYRALLCWKTSSLDDLF